MSPDSSWAIIGDHIAVTLSQSRVNIFDVRPVNTLADRGETAKGNAVLKMPLALGVDATFTLTGEQSWKSSRQGYPSMAIFVPGTSPYSPFGSDLFLYRFVPGPVMKQRTAVDALHARAALQGGFRGWQWDLTSARRIEAISRNVSFAFIPADSCLSAVHQRSPFDCAVGILQTSHPTKMKQRPVTGNEKKGPNDRIWVVAISAMPSWSAVWRTARFLVL